MPGRLVPLVNDQIYHVFNRGIDHRSTFTNKLEYRRAIEIIEFYRFTNLPMRLSKFLKLVSADREEIMKEIKTHNKLVEIIAYCLMPNHFHLLVKQLRDNGISKFLSNLQNSYTRYFNTKNSRDGSLFLDQFKAVRIETDEQLVHVSRYIHLNPLTSFVVKNFNKLIDYPWSSLNEYISKHSIVCEASTVLNFFGRKNQQNKYLKFIKDQINYQRELHRIQHLIME